MTYLRVLLMAGSSRWPPGCSMRCQSGESLGHTGWQMVEALAPGEKVNVTLNLVSPSAPGVYQGQWRLATPTGHLFGGETPAASH